VLRRADTYLPLVFRFIQMIQILLFVMTGLVHALCRASMEAASAVLQFRGWPGDEPGYDE
jgi:hypothetical protein